MRYLVRTAPIALGASLLIASAAAGPAGPARELRQTHGFIESLAIDGPLVAYDVMGAQPRGPACNRVYGWNLTTHRSGRVSGRGTCDADSSSTGAGVPELAVAGSRIAWITNIGGNTESFDRLYTSSFPPRGERRLAAVLRTGNVDCLLVGRALGGLVGSGSLLAYNLWRIEPADPGDEESCAEKKTSGALRRIGKSGTSPIRNGLDTLIAADADAGRIAVAHDDSTVELFSSAGTPLQTIGVETPKQVALAGRSLVVLTRSKRIQVYSVTTGKPGPGRATPGGSGHLDAAAGAAAYAVGPKLHVFKLSTGKDTVVATAPKPIAAVAISSVAIAYAYNVSKRVRGTYRDIGNVVVIPRS
jgi:hypothetical protein